MSGIVPLTIAEVDRRCQNEEIWRQDLPSGISTQVPPRADWIQVSHQGAQ